MQKRPDTERIQATEYGSPGKISIVDQSTNFIAGYTDGEKACIHSETGAIVFGDHTRIVKYTGFDFARGADGIQIILSNNPCMPELLLYPSILKIDLSNYGYARHDKFLKDSSILVSESNIARSFYDKVAPMYKHMTHDVFENIERTRLRDWLLPMLVNGRAFVSAENNTDADSNMVEMTKTDDERFSLWPQNQGIAARGEPDQKTLREL